VRPGDLLGFALRSLFGVPLRSFLIVLSMAIGVAGVVVLTWLGSAARSYVTEEFRALGTNMVVVLPGRAETTGGAPPLLGETARDLTIDDAAALLRSPFVRWIAPIVAGDAPVVYGGRAREANVLGTTPGFFAVRRLELAHGRLWPDGDPNDAIPECVIGSTVARELFGGRSGLGEWVRIQEYRFRVVGVLAATGRSIGVDLDQIVVLPVGSALAVFDTPALFRIVVEVRGREVLEEATAAIERIIRDRHEGELDVTVITQEAVLGTFDRIFDALTLSVAGIASISLLVAGVLVMNVMVVSVSQRKEEIGLMKALGAPARQVRDVFLAEATMLSFGGAALGVAFGHVLTLIGTRLYPVLSAGTPVWAIVAAVGVACGSGLAFGVAPARRAARLDPVEALARR
jgi:putative ABC transport system permease protein